jgi:hypothetical protein
MQVRIAALSVAVLATLLFSISGSAHHSYAMFDGSQVKTITGTVAKLEWINPHVFLWLYVRNPESETGYDIYALENGSPNVLRERGWSPTFFEAGEVVAVSYWPAINGEDGGHFAVATRTDGTVIYGAGGAGGSPDAGRAVPPPERPQETQR